MLVVDSVFAVDTNLISKLFKLLDYLILYFAVSMMFYYCGIAVIFLQFIWIFMLYYQDFVFTN